MGRLWRFVRRVLLPPAWCGLSGCSDGLPHCSISPESETVVMRSRIVCTNHRIVIYDAYWCKLCKHAIVSEHVSKHAKDLTWSWNVEDAERSRSSSILEIPCKFSCRPNPAPLQRPVRLSELCVVIRSYLIVGLVTQNTFFCFAFSQMTLWTKWFLTFKIETNEVAGKNEREWWVIALSTRKTIIFSLF